MTIARTIIRTGLPAAFALLACAPAQAAGRLQVGITGGTLGIGPEAGYRASDTFGIRGNATFLNLSHDFDSNDLDYRGKARLKSAGIMLDAYPFGGGFRVSAGARANGNDGRVRARSARSVTIGRTTYTPAQIGDITGDAETRNVAPALTIGWAGQNRQGFVAGVEAGALFQGRVRIRDFRNNTGLISAADLETERRDIQDDVDDYKVYPIVQLTLGYRF